jgi:hypothetical protein
VICAVDHFPFCSFRESLYSKSISTATWPSDQYWVSQFRYKKYKKLIFWRNQKIFVLKIHLYKIVFDISQSKIILPLFVLQNTMLVDSGVNQSTTNKEEFQNNYAAAQVYFQTLSVVNIEQSVAMRVSQRRIVGLS